MSPLETLQADISARLNASESFRFVPVLTVRPRSAEDAVLIQDTIDQALMGLVEKNGKSGMAIQVLMPMLRTPNANTPGPQLTAEVAIRIVENPLVNMGTAGTRLSAEDMALTVLHELHLVNFGDGAALTAARNAMAPSFEDPAKVIYDVRLEKLINLARLVKAAAPVITVGASTVTITGPAGATLYFTTDGTFPCLENPGAVEYTAAFTKPAAGTLIRAVAFPTSDAASDVTHKTIS